MGCDIHMFVQYRNIERAKKVKKEGGYDYWWGFGGHLNPGRNYTLFGILAGVRDNPMDDEKMFYPRGLPGFELSYEAKDSLYLYISDDECSEENSCTLEQAQRWGRPIINDSQGKPWRTLHPDWHSHTWLTTQELAQAYRWYKKVSEGYGIGLEYRVLLKMMKELEDKGKNEVVVVFWFDN